MAFAWQCTSVYNPPYIAAYAYTSHVGTVIISSEFQELLKELLRVSKANIFTLCQQLHHLFFICLVERRCQYYIPSLSSLSYSVFICHVSLSVPSFQNFYHQFLLVMTKSYGDTPPNSTSGWRDGELKFLYLM